MIEKAVLPKKAKVQKDVSPTNAEGGTFEMIKTIVIAIVVAVTIRTVAYEPFSIPSGSMIPTLLVGDYLFVSKYSYGYSHYSLPMKIITYPGRLFYKEPQRGDVVVFKKPTNPNIDYIKRIIGLPGDTVRMIEGRLYINGKMVKRDLTNSYPLAEPFGFQENYREFDETLPNGVVHHIVERSDSGDLDNTIAYKVPAGHFFMMGDNRDGSQDSRVLDQVGYVPVENLVGRAEVLFFSLEEGAKPWQVWKWPWSIRFSRIFNRIH